MKHPKFVACCANLQTAVRQHDVLVGRTIHEQGLGFAINSEDDTIVEIQFCPFCGKKLPDREVQ